MGQRAHTCRTRSGATAHTACATAIARPRAWGRRAMTGAIKMSCAALWRPCSVARAMDARSVGSKGAQIRRLATTTSPPPSTTTRACTSTNVACVEAEARAARKTRASSRPGARTGCVMTATTTVRLSRNAATLCVPQCCAVGACCDQRRTPVLLPQRHIHAARCVFRHVCASFLPSLVGATDRLSGWLLTDWLAGYRRVWMGQR